MKKYMMLGVNSKTKLCCQLYCLIPFDNLVSSEIEASDFVHNATNWSGCDGIERTLGFINMKQTGKNIVLDKKIMFFGTDYDMGHEYPWRFEVDEIHELT